MKDETFTEFILAHDVTTVDCSIFRRKARSLAGINMVPGFYNKVKRRTKLGKPVTVDITIYS